MKSNPSPTRSALLGLVVVTLAVLSMAAGSVTADDYWKRTSMLVPESTTDGDWDGTWWYLNRDAKIALWLRTVDGKPQVKLQFENLKAIETFTTDWTGRSEYATRNGAGNFAMPLTEADANTIKADWDWTFVVGRTTRQQRGKITVFRSGTGRQLVVLFDRYEFYIGPVGETQWQEVDQSWTFRKASKRQILWEELPF